MIRSRRLLFWDSNLPKRLLLFNINIWIELQFSHLLKRGLVFFGKEEYLRTRFKRKPSGNRCACMRGFTIFVENKTISRQSRLQNISISRILIIIGGNGIGGWRTGKMTKQVFLNCCLKSDKGHWSKAKLGISFWFSSVVKSRNKWSQVQNVLLYSDILWPKTIGKNTAR